jgi:hypothetical protein
MVYHEKSAKLDNFRVFGIPHVPKTKKNANLDVAYFNGLV